MQKIIMSYLQKCSRNQRDPQQQKWPAIRLNLFQKCVFFVGFVYRRELFLPLTYRLAGAE